MTPYEPNVSRFEGSKAERLERAIAADIADGVLEHGQKLPTHRALAHALGMTAGTISRAYVRLARRGLVSSEVGRGTFVQRKPFTGLQTELGTPQDEKAASIDLAVNRQPSPEVQRLLADAFQSLSTNPRVLSLMTYQPDTGIGGHREAFADWLADGKLAVQ